MSFDAVHPAWTRSKESFFDRENFLRLIDHYEILGWGFQVVDVFSHEGSALNGRIRPCPWCPRLTLTSYQHASG
jgi:hypothetical protein